MGMQENDQIVASVLNATKQYRTGDTVITALKPTTVAFRRGELTLIIGPSGSGKTTLLSLLGCVIFPTSGDVYLDRQRVNGLPARALADLRLRHIGFVFQSFNLIAPLNALDNVILPLLLLGIHRHQARDRALAALAKVNMTDRRNNLPRALSGGQQQRIAIARALVTDPSLILCDEPTAALDIKSATLVMEELRMLANAGKSVALVTHDTRLKTYADRILYVNDGVVSDTPPPDDLFH